MHLLKNSNLSRFLIFVLILSFFPEDEKKKKQLANVVSVRNERTSRPYSNIVRSETGLPVNFTEWVLIQTSFIEFITL